jgi:cell division septal protein FtsQ
MTGRGGNLRRQKSGRFDSRSGRALNQGRRSKRPGTRYQTAAPAIRGRIERGRLSPRMFDVIMLLILAWLLYWLITADMFYVTGLTVKGSGRVSEGELLAASGLSGIHIFWADGRAAAQGIEALPDVKSAQVQCRLPAACTVKVVEDPSLLVWRQGQAQVWIGADGEVLPARGDLPHSIIVDAVGSTALRPGDRVDPALVEGVLELDRLQPDIQTYQYSTDHGLSFRNDQGWEIRLGIGPEMETRLGLMQEFEAYFQSQGITPSYLDLRFPEAPYYGE